MHRGKGSGRKRERQRGRSSTLIASRRMFPFQHFRIEAISQVVSTNKMAIIALNTTTCSVRIVMLVCLGCCLAIVVTSQNLHTGHLVCKLGKVTRRIAGIALQRLVTPEKLPTKPFTSARKSSSVVVQQWLH